MPMSSDVVTTRILPLLLVVGACSSRSSTEPRPSSVVAATEPSSPSPTKASDGPAATRAPAPTWVAALDALKLGMRPGLAPDQASSTPEQAHAALARAGGVIDCSAPTWVSDEDGVLDGTCEGTLPVEGSSHGISLTFRRFEIPGESGTPGLLTIMVHGPFINDHEGLVSWLSMMRRGLEVTHGAPEPHGADSQWHLADRHIQLHDASQAPCGGLCRAYLWIGGKEHPQLVPRGLAPAPH